MSFGDWLSIAGLAVSVIGFGLTIWQLIRSVNASDATTAAIKNSSERMFANYLLVLLPQFKTFEQELDEAAETNDRKLARRTLVSYTHNAQRAAALLLKSGDSAEMLLASNLKNSATAASTAKASLMADPALDVLPVVQSLLKQVGEVASEAEGVVAAYQMKVG